MKKLLLVILCVMAITAYHSHAMEVDKPATDEDLQRSIKWFEEQALDGGILDAFVSIPKPNWFGGDREKTRQVLRSLLAVPLCDWEPAQKEVDLCLIKALREDKVAEVQAAIEQGANVNCYTDQGGTPLSIAIDRFPLVKLLLDNGAKPNMPFGTYWTPLACAVWGHDGSENSMNIVKLLLERGARPQISVLGDEEGTSPVSSFHIPGECVSLMQFLLSYVSLQEVAPIIEGKADKEQVVHDIIETRKLLISLSKPTLIWKFDRNDPRFKPLKDALSLNLFEENYQQAITKNVEKLLAL